MPMRELIETGVIRTILDKPLTYSSVKPWLNVGQAWRE